MNNKIVLLFIGIITTTALKAQSDTIIAKESLLGKWHLDSTKIGNTKGKIFNNSNNDFIKFTNDKLVFSSDEEELEGTWKLKANKIIVYIKSSTSDYMEIIVLICSKNKLVISDGAKNSINKEATSYFTKL